MKIASIALIYAVLAFPAITRTLAKPPTSARSWAGPWKARLEDQPGVIFTLSDDNGRLIGGVAYQAGSRHDGYHSDAIMNLRVAGCTLRFEVIHRGDSLEREKPLT